MQRRSEHRQRSRTRTRGKPPLAECMAGKPGLRAVLATLARMQVPEKLSLDGLISHRIRLDDIGPGFDLLAAGKARRVVIDF